MKKKISLLEEFGYNTDKKNINPSNYEIVNDKDKVLKIKDNIVKELYKNSIFDEYSVNEFIKDTDINELDKEYLKELVYNDIYGSGPLFSLFNDKNINDIMINGCNDVYIGIDGQTIKEENIKFIDDDHLIRIINNLIKYSNKELNSATPMINCRLKDGSKLSAVIKPISVKGPVVVIKKPMNDLVTIDNLIGSGELTPYMARFLEACVIGKLNIIVTGTSGSGKTTLLNVLSSFIPDYERIITIEDVSELKLSQSNVISLEKVNYDNINNLDLINIGYNMNPDRLIIGEIEGKESSTILDIISSGINGILMSINSQDSVKCLYNLRKYISLERTDYSLDKIDRDILNSIDIVISLDKLSNGRRKITSISELTINKDKLMLKDIFVFKNSEKDLNGSFIRYDFYPDVVKKLKSRGITDIDYIFSNIGDNNE